MKIVDFSIMTSILTLNNSSIIVSGIGSTQVDMDTMLANLVSVVPDNLVSGRVISLLGGAPPSAAGLANVAILEGYGINVNL